MAVPTPDDAEKQQQQQQLDHQHEQQQQQAKLDLDEVEKADKLFDQDGVDVPTQEEQDAYIRKLDWHIMPVIFVIYMLSVLDRSNLGNAHQAGLDDGIGLVGNQYNLLGTIFYLGCTFHCPTKRHVLGCTLHVQRIPGRLVANNRGLQ